MTTIEEFAKKKENKALQMEEFEADYLRVMKRMAWEKLAEGVNEDYVKNATDEHIEDILQMFGIKITAPKGFHDCFQYAMFRFLPKN